MNCLCTRTVAGLMTATLISLSSATFALNPVEGWYAGLYLGVSYAPDTLFPVTGPFGGITLSNASLAYGVLGGVGGELGYRCGHLRAEGQILYNNNPYSSITIDNLMINGTRTTFNGQAYPVSMRGQTNIGAALVNGFFDLYTPNRDNVDNIAPYVGLGIGYAYVQNNLTITYSNTTTDPSTITLQQGDFWRNYTSLAGQAIAGVNYFMDDFTTIGIDFRYFSTTKQTHSGRYEFISFDTQNQIYSANLVFNGAFDLG